MNYELVRLEEKTVAGFCARTSNTDPKMGEVIGALWQRLFSTDALAHVSGRVGESAIGLYSNYENGASGRYTITVGVPVSQAVELPQDMEARVIPAGVYAKFTTNAKDPQAVASLWQEIWRTPLDRTFTGDFEEYPPREIFGDIAVYIAVRG